MNAIVTTPALDVPNLLDTPKEGLISYADKLVNSYVEDGKDILALMAEAAKLEVLAQRIKDQAKEVAINEVRSYGPKGVTKLGVGMTVKEVGVTYVYKLDPVWQSLNQTVAEATAKRKEQEDILKALPYEGRTMMDEETAQEYRAYPPAKKGGDGVVLSIK